MAALISFIQAGKYIDYTPAAAVVAGDLVDLGGLIGIAPAAIAAGVVGAVAVEGAFSATKSGSAGPVFAVGDHVFWSKTSSVAVRTGGSGCVYLGICIEAAATGDTAVKFRLAPHGLAADLVDKTWEDIDISGGSKTLDAEDVGKVMNVTVGHATNVVTLPAIAAGLAFIVRCGTSGQRVAISPNASDKIMGPDIAGVDNKDRILAAATSFKGDYCSLESEGTNGYYIRSQRGVWTNEA